MNLTRSTQAFDRAQRVLIGGVNSPVRAFKSVGGTPPFVRRAHGATIEDLDGNAYVDLVGSWGPAIVGHAHPAVVEAVQRAAADGLSFGACHEAEAELAELILSALPGTQKLRFVNSGTEAAMSVLRLVRAATDRPRVIKFKGNYHGHVDSLLVSAGSGATTLGTPDSAGVTADIAAMTKLAGYNDLASVQGLMGDDVAAIIVEPVAGNMGFVRPNDDFLQGLRQLADRHGSLLVFDEVMTGFRVAWGGWQRVCGVVPDLTMLGKVIGGGMPVAAYAGPSKIMDLVSPLGPVYQAGTLSGNPLGMAAGLATLRLCQQGGFYEHLGAISQSLCTALAAAAKQAGVPILTDSAGGMFGFFFTDRPVTNYAEAQATRQDLYPKWFHAMMNRGIWLPPSGYEAMFVSGAHGEAEVQAIAKAAGESFKSL